MIRQVTISRSYKINTLLAILSIIMFIVVYLLLLAIVIGISAGLGYIGLIMVFASDNPLMSILGFGMSLIGLFLTYYMVKFIFIKNEEVKFIRKHIKKEEAPELFEIIESIVKEIGTQFPRRVYIVPDANAYVAYSNSVLSLILPVRKDIYLGMGLINTSSVDELKSIMSHEFGHFSQKAMSVGSYIHHVNKILYKTLFDQGKFNATVKDFGSSNISFAITSAIVMGVVSIINYILKDVYALILKAHGRLSRDMEFHADAVATSINGSETMKKALIKTELSQISFNQVFNYYNFQTETISKPDNLYQQQSMVFDYMKSSIPDDKDNKTSGLQYHQIQYKSKIEINNPWDTHPPMEKRLEAIDRIKVDTKTVHDDEAKTLFRNWNELEREMTDSSFIPNDETLEAKIEDKDRFFESFIKLQTKYDYPKIYHHYFDIRDIFIDFETENPSSEHSDSSTLFSPEIILQVFNSESLKHDLRLIEFFRDNSQNQKYFEYDGESYRSDSDNTRQLIKTLEGEIESIEQNLKINDGEISKYLVKKALECGKLEQMKQSFMELDLLKKEVDSQCRFTAEYLENLSFVQSQLPVADIISNFTILKEDNKQLIKLVNEILEKDSYRLHLSDSEIESLRIFLRDLHIYFSKTEYNDHSLQLLLKTLHFINSIFPMIYISEKKRLLEDIAEFIN